MFSFIINKSCQGFLYLTMTFIMYDAHSQGRNSTLFYNQRMVSNVFKCPELAFQNEVFQQ